MPPVGSDWISVPRLEVFGTHQARLPLATRQRCPVLHQTSDGRDGAAVIFPYNDDGGSVPIECRQGIGTTITPLTDASGHGRRFDRSLLVARRVPGLAFAPLSRLHRLTQYYPGILPFTAMSH
jgi:hypothetical protein